MIWRSTALILAAFVVAGLAVWFTPDLLGLLGLAEFTFIGQLGSAILALSVLEAVFSRLPASPGH
jgi:hypothetical protein